MKKMVVDCGYRIHINSIDMNGFSGRGCGGLGFAVENPKLQISVTKADAKEDVVNAHYSEKVKKIVNDIKSSYKLDGHYMVNIDSEIEEHVGLGSETQMIFAITCAMLKLNNMDCCVDEIAKQLHLAGVSGIGYGAFKYGNFVVDSGYIMGENKRNFVEHSKKPPEIIFNSPIPDNWKVIIVIPQKVYSLSSEEEDKFFNMYTPVPEDEVKQICYHTFMGVIPAIAENDFEHFRSSLSIVTKLGTKKAELKINEKNTDEILKKMNEK